MAAYDDGTKDDAGLCELVGHVVNVVIKYYSVLLICYLLSQQAYSLSWLNHLATYSFMMWLFSYSKVTYNMQLGFANQDFFF